MSHQQGSTTALVLRVRDYRERDQWVSLLSPEFGKFDLLAKGVRTMQSKRRSALQSGNILRCSWTGELERAVLTEVMLQEVLLQKTDTLERLRDFSAVMEVLNHVSMEHIDQDFLYEQGVGILSMIGKQESYNRGVVRQALLDTLQEQGFSNDENAFHPHVSVAEILEASIGKKVRSFAFLQV